MVKPENWFPVTKRILMEKKYDTDCGEGPVKTLFDQ